SLRAHHKSHRNRLALSSTFARMVLRVRMTSPDVLYSFRSSRSPAIMSVENREMISLVLIVGISAVLFAHWFRCACLLIISAQTTKDFASQVALSNNLSCLQIRDQLTAGPGSAELGALLRALDRDYGIVTTLLKSATSTGSEGGGMEHFMLRIDY